MRRLLLISGTVAVLLAGVGIASAQHHQDRPGPVTFTPEHGRMLHQHAIGQHHNSFRDPSFHAQVGAALPGSVQLHPLPDTLAGHVPSAHQYRYGIVNDRPVIVDHSTRRVIHSFE